MLSQIYEISFLSTLSIMHMLEPGPLQHNLINVSRRRSPLPAHNSAPQSARPWPSPHRWWTPRWRGWQGGRHGGMGGGGECNDGEGGTGEGGAGVDGGGVDSDGDGCCCRCRSRRCCCHCCCCSSGCCLPRQAKCVVVRIITQPPSMRAVAACRRRWALPPSAA